MRNTFIPPARDTAFCTMVIPVLPATGHTGPALSVDEIPSSIYICAKAVPCPDHPQESEAR